MRLKMSARCFHLRSAVALLACAGCAFTSSIAAAGATAESGAANARADSAGIAHARTEARGFGSYSPHGALGVGALATLAPAAISVLLNPPGSHSRFAWEASLTLSAAAGICVGPALGLASGGRGDLARRGLLVRGVGLAACAVGLEGFVMAFDETHESGAPLRMMFIGIVGAGVIAVSSIHDLAITPSAVARGRTPRADLGVRPDGKLAVRVRF